MEREVARAAGLCAVLFAIAGTAQAQVHTARLHGRVLDKASSVGLPGVEVLIVGSNRTIQTDSGGNFAISDLPNGYLELRVRAIGFQPMQLHLDLHDGEDLERNVEMQPSGVGKAAQELPALMVKEHAVNYRLVDFERRRQTGRGHYLTDEDIRASGANTLQAAVRGLRGVNFECRADGVCRIHMARAPNNCDPQYVVDTRVDNMFGPDTPIRDIVGLEVYTGPSDVPGEFAGRDAGCGVVVIWTRSGPAPRKR